MNEGKSLNETGDWCRKVAGGGGRRSVASAVSAVVKDRGFSVASTCCASRPYFTPLSSPSSVPFCLFFSPFVLLVQFCSYLFTLKDPATVQRRSSQFLLFPTRVFTDTHTHAHTSTHARARARESARTCAYYRCSHTRTHVTNTLITSFLVLQSVCVTVYTYINSAAITIVHNILFFI